MAHKKSGLNPHPKLMLNKEIASALRERILEGKALFTGEQFKTNEPSTFTTKNGDVQLKPQTYNTWMKRRMVIPGTKRTLHQYLGEARHERRMKVHEDEQKELVRQAQHFLSELQKLPLGTETKRVLKKMKVIEGGRLQQIGQEEEVISTPMDPRVAAIKQKGSEFVLDRLSPDYKKDAEKNSLVMVDLAALRKAKEEREQPKQVPKSDYKVSE